MKKIIISIILSFFVVFLTLNSVFAAEYDYTTPCVATGSCSCLGAGNTCSENDDCVQENCNYQSCPEPPKEHSSLVQQACLAIYDHTCGCDNVGAKLFCTGLGSCSCEVQGACRYKCDQGYEYKNGACVSEIPESTPPSPGRFCCQSESRSGQYRCYITGCCCEMGTENEYWYHECPCPETTTTTSSSTSSTSTSLPPYSFRIWVEGPSLLKIGEKVPVLLYIQNLGENTDNYDIDYNIDSDYSHLIDVDMSDASSMQDLSSKEIRVKTVRVMLLESHVSADITFTATSENTEEQGSATLSVLEGDFEMSLPEFGLIGIIVLVSLATLIYIKL